MTMHFSNSIPQMNKMPLMYELFQIAISASIFMTVAIAWERYIAVHYPLDYNQAMNDAHAVRKRVVKYVGPVLALAVAFNATKFFEGDVVWEEALGHNGTVPGRVSQDSLVRKGPI